MPFEYLTQGIGIGHLDCDRGIQRLPDAARRAQRLHRLGDAMSDSTRGTDHHGGVAGQSPRCTEPGPNSVPVPANDHASSVVNGITGASIVASIPKM